MQVSIEPAAANVHIPEDGMVHWLCRLEGDAGHVAFHASLAKDIFSDRPPTTEQVIELLSADIETLVQYPDEASWTEAFGSSEERVAARRELDRIKVSFEAAFGADALHDLVHDHEELAARAAPMLP